MKYIVPEGVDKASSVALRCVHDTLNDLLIGTLSDPIYHLASFEPGSGKTATLCGFLKAWKFAGFVPANGALIVLSTHKEIQDCIVRSGLDPADFAVLIAKDKELSEMGRIDHQAAPVLFTTQEKLRRLCDGQPSFAAVEALHFLGQPRRLRVWDEAFLPATGEIIRKDTLLSPLEDLRPVAPIVAASLDALGDSLGVDRAGQVVEVPTASKAAYTALKARYGEQQSERWRPLIGLAGRQALIVHGGGHGLYLAGPGRTLPTDFAPALILDASGRVRETYGTMEANGILRRLPEAHANYSRLRVHHWDRAASRSTLMDPKARQEVLQAAAEAINDSGDQEEPWLVIHPKARASDGYDAFKELSGLITNPQRLTSLHWGNHHGTNDYRHIRKVLVLGLWRLPEPAYAALHAAAGGCLATAADRATLDTIRDGEHRHNLLQAICRSSVRNWTDGLCGECEVFLVGRLGKEGKQLLQKTFPGARVGDWTPVNKERPQALQRLIQALEDAFAPVGVTRVQKGAVRASLGLQSGEALAKVVRREDFRSWAVQRGIRVTTRAFEMQRI